jgi:hypothetical protein
MRPHSKQQQGTRAYEHEPPGMIMNVKKNTDNIPHKEKKSKGCVTPWAFPNLHYKVS